MAAYGPDEIATVERRVRKTLHPKQRAFAFDPSPRCACLVGRGGGKSLGVIMRLLLRMVRFPKQNCLFIAATRDSAERLIWREVQTIVLDKLRLTKADGFNQSKLTLTLPNGSRLVLTGCDDRNDINKLRGITYHEVGVDEVGSIKAELLEELLLEVLGPRLVGALSLIGTPGKQLVGMFYEATRPGGDQHRAWEDRELPEFANWDRWSSHHWHIRDGVDAGIEALEEIYKVQLAEKARNGWSDDNPRWRREYLGEWAADETANVYLYKPHTADGQQWNQWSPELDAFGAAILPADLKDVGYAIGIDVGFKDAFALEVFAFSYSDPRRTLWHVYEFYRTRQYAQAIAKLLIGEDLNHDRYGGIVGHLGWPAVMVGDFARAGGPLLTELQTVYGITVTEAAKRMNYKENSVELTNSMLHEGRIKVMKGSHLESEMLALQWVVDQFGKRTENKAQANHACLVAGTMVETASGPRPIEDMQVGELVWTRAGLRPVIAAWCSGVAPVYTVTIAGRSITGTNNHPFWTDTGWKDLELLTPNDMVATWVNTDPQKSLCSKASDTADTHTGPTRAWRATSLLRAARSFIAQSTRRSVDQFRRAITSTMRMAMSQITVYPTSKSSRPGSTSASTCATLNALPRLEPPSNAPWSSRQHGIAPQKDARGTNSTPRKLPLRPPTGHASASSATSGSSPSENPQRFAAPTAMPSSVGSQESTTLTCSARNAASRSAVTNTLAPKIARRPAAKPVPGGYAAVYNLTVDVDHEYFANGVLVSNTDALIYLRDAIASLLPSAASQPAPSSVGVPSRAVREVVDNDEPEPEPTRNEDDLYQPGDW